MYEYVTFVVFDVEGKGATMGRWSWIGARASLSPRLVGAGINREQYWPQGIVIGHGEGTEREREKKKIKTFTDVR